jgi:hypothetical protein
MSLNIKDNGHLQNRKMADAAILYFSARMDQKNFNSIGPRLSFTRNEMIIVAQCDAFLYRPNGHIKAEGMKGR